MNPTTYDNLSALIEAEGLVSVAGMSDGGWDWTEIEVYWSPRARRYFWYTDAGCSCNYFGEDRVAVGDLSDGNRKAAMKALAEWAGSSLPEPRARELGKIRDHREVAA